VPFLPSIYGFSKLELSRKSNGKTDIITSEHCEEKEASACMHAN